MHTSVPTDGWFVYSLVCLCDVAGRDVVVKITAALPTQNSIALNELPNSSGPPTGVSAARSAEPESSGPSSGCTVLSWSQGPGLPGLAMGSGQSHAEGGEASDMESEYSCRANATLLFLLCI